MSDPSYKKVELKVTDLVTGEVVEAYFPKAEGVFFETEYSEDTSPTPPSFYFSPAFIPKIERVVITVEAPRVVSDERETNYAFLVTNN